MSLSNLSIELFGYSVIFDSFWDLGTIREHALCKHKNCFNLFVVFYRFKRLISYNNKNTYNILLVRMNE